MRIIISGINTIGNNTILSDNVTLGFPSREHMGKEEFPGTTIGVDGVIRSGTIIYSDVQCPVSEELSSRVLSLPVHPGVTIDDCAYICDTINEVE